MALSPLRVPRCMTELWAADPPVKGCQGSNWSRAEMHQPWRSCTQFTTRNRKQPTYMRTYKYTLSRQQAAPCAAYTTILQQTRAHHLGTSPESSAYSKHNIDSCCNMLLRLLPPCTSPQGFRPPLPSAQHRHQARPNVQRYPIPPQFNISSSSSLHLCSLLKRRS